MQRTAALRTAAVPACSTLAPSRFIPQPRLEVVDAKREHEIPTSVAQVRCVLGLMLRGLPPGCPEVHGTYGMRAAGRYSSPRHPPPTPGACCPAPLGTHNTQKAGTVRSPQGRRCQHSLSREARDEPHRLAIGAVLHRTRAELCRGGEQLVRRHLLENSEPPR